MPNMQRSVGGDLDEDALEESELLWQAMLRVPREEHSACRDRGDARETWPADYVRQIRKIKGMPAAQKTAQVLTLVHHALEMPNLDWKVLEEAVDGMPEEIVEGVRAAKRATYLSAVVCELPDRAVLELDEDVRAYMETDEFAADLRSRREELRGLQQVEREREVRAKRARYMPRGMGAVRTAAKERGTTRSRPR
jgi:hypothetical protein